MTAPQPEYYGGAVRPYFAIVSATGETFDQPMAAAEHLRIFRPGADGCELVDLRDAPPPEKGIGRWRKLAESLHDCAALLVNGIGEAPILILANHQIRTYMLQGQVGDALKIIAAGGDLSPMKVPEPPRLGNPGMGGCCGGGGGRRRHGGCRQAGSDAGSVLSASPNPTAETGHDQTAPGTT